MLAPVAHDLRAQTRRHGNFERGKIALALKYEAGELGFHGMHGVTGLMDIRDGNFDLEKRRRVHDDYFTSLSTNRVACPLRHALALFKDLFEHL